MAQTSLALFLASKLQLERDSLEFNDVFRSSVLCISKGITAFDFQHAVKPYTKGPGRTTLPSAKVLRLEMVGSCYNSLSLKLFCLRLSKLNRAVVGLLEVKKLAAEYKIIPGDARRIRNLWNTDRSFRVKLKAVSSKIPTNSSQWDEKSLVDVFGVMYPLLQRHAKYLSRRKLRFAVLANNLSFEDIVNDLMTHVWSRYMQAIPTNKEPLHLLNSLRLAITNEINNMCDKFSTQKNARLVDVGKDGNNMNRSMLLVVSENQMPTFGDNEETNIYASFGSVNPYSQLDLNLSLDRVLNSKECLKNSRKGNLLRILLGVVDPNFTRWLRENRYLGENEDNDDLQERIDPKVFNRLIARYMRVPMDSVVSFLDSVGAQLAPELSRKKA